MNRFKLQTPPAQEITEPLKIGDDCVWQGTGTVTKIVLEDNHDGTEMQTAIIKPLFLEVKKSNEPLQAPIFKDEVKHKSWSQKLRDLLYRLHIEKGGSETDFKPYYDRIMSAYCEQIGDKIEEARGL